MATERIGDVDRRLGLCIRKSRELNWHHASATHGERCAERLTHRNGYRAYRQQTRVGTVNLRIPKFRQRRNSRESLGWKVWAVWEWQIKEKDTVELGDVLTSFLDS